MEDWTDIFAEELKDIEETLPADDWTVVRQKYAAVRRRRKAVLWSAVAGVAAVLAVFAVLFAGDFASELPLVADREIPAIEPEIPVVSDSLQVQDTVPEDISDEVPESTPECKPVPRKKFVPRPEAKFREDVLVAEAEGDEIDVVKDTMADPVDVLIADNQQNTPSSEPVVNEAADEWNQGKWVDGKERGVRSPRRRKISIGVSGASAFAGGSVMVFDNVFQDMENPPMEPLPDDPQDPSDTSSLNQNAARARLRSLAPMPATRSGRTLVSEDYDHNMPVSYGISARFTLTKRFSLNTGLNYTLYTSRRTCRYSDGSVENDKQSVHYLGIPLRADWMLIDKPRFGMYIGVGTQVDKCVYAKVGNERLYDDAVLWSLNGALGVQYNITPRLSLYAEPELTTSLGYSRIYTHRDDAQFMMTARFGLRVNL